MPAKSAKQYGLMQAVAHGSLKGLGIPTNVAKDFVSKTSASKRSSFSKAVAKRRKA